MKVKDILDRPERWTKGAAAKNEKGQTVDVNAPCAACFCLTGAVEFCYRTPDSKAKALRAIKDALFQLFKQLDPVMFNDDPKTTFEQVRKVVLWADA